MEDLEFFCTNPANCYSGNPSNKNESCRHCPYLEIHEHLFSSSHVRIHNYDTEPPRSYLITDEDKIKRLFIMENPEFLELD
jgi:hypothetical protein